MKTILNILPIHAMRFIMTLLAFLLGSYHLSAQQLSENDRLSNAIGLYHNQIYEAARLELASFADGDFREQANYYLAMSALKLKHPDAEQLLNDYARQFPHSQYTRGMDKKLGEYFYAQGNFVKSIFYLSKPHYFVDHELIFKLGLSYFNLENYDSALLTFQKIDNSFTNQEKESKYYVGYIHHVNGDNEQAITQLESAFDAEMMGQSAVRLTCQILFQEKKFEKLISLIETGAYATTNDIELLTFYADALYMSNNFEKARGVYDLIYNLDPALMNRQQMFRAGYSHYQSNNWEGAESYLKQCSIEEDSLGTYAAYYQGIAYCQSQNLPFAFSSFQRVRQDKFPIKEHAAYYATYVLFKQKRFQEAVESGQLYVSNYTKGQYTKDINEIISESYIKTDNYDLALTYLDNVDELSLQLKETYQRVSYLKANSTLRAGKLDEAKGYFLKSMIHNANDSIIQHSYYQMAELLFRQGDYQEAMYYFRSVANKYLKLHAKAQYGLGYTLYTTEKYKDAIKVFRQVEFFEFDNESYLHDIIQRIADCYQLKKDFVSAIIYYKKAIEIDNEFVAQSKLQLGICYYRLNQDSLAIPVFEDLLSNHSQSAEAGFGSYQLAKIRYEQGDYNGAINGFQVFIDNYGSNENIPEALVNQAVAYENLEQYATSASNYEAVIDRFPRSSWAENALIGLQNLQSQGHYDDLDDYASKFKTANPDSDAVEHIDFASSKSNYYNQNYSKCIDELKSFILLYPHSPMVIEAQFFLAESHFRLDQLDEALRVYEELSKVKDFEKFEKVIQRLAIVYQLQGNFVNSNSCFYQLKQTSRSKKTIDNINKGLFKNYDHLNQTDSVLTYGEILLADTHLDLIHRQGILMIIGKSLLNNDRPSDAIDYLEKVATLKIGEESIEANYRLGLIYVQLNDPEKAKDYFYKITTSNNSDSPWLGLSYLTLAEIFIESGELFQANATLNSVIENTSDATLRLNAQELINTINPQNDQN